jgi:hypothetical protein
MCLFIFRSFSVLAVYFIGGMLFRRFIGGATGYEVIPNSDFWNDLPLLIKVLYSNGVLLWRKRFF